MRIALLGDIAFFGYYRYGNIDFESCFGIIKNELKSCDYIIGNLETPLTNSQKTIGGKSAYIKGLPNDAQILKEIGVTHVSLANNHMFDYKEIGLKDTIVALNEVGIKWFGAYGKNEELVSDDTKIKLRGYCCYTTNGKGLSESKNGINALDAYKMEEDLISDFQNGFVTLASCHWGEEHVHYPNYNHVKLARKMAKYNTTIIHGHHPHVIQGLERIHNSLIAYSLGNFCFDDVYTPKSKEPLIRLSTDNKESFVLIVDIVGTSIVDYRELFFTFEDGTHKVDQSIAVKVEKWSSFLNVDENRYNSVRLDDLQKYINGRKKKRNLEWYLKRINFESVKMIYNSKRNRKKYLSLVNEYINDFEDEK